MNDPNATTGQKVAYGMDTLLSAAGTAFAVKGFMNSIKCSTPQTNTNQKVQDIADEGTGGNPKINAEDLKYSNSAQHSGRPYQESTQLMQEIMDSQVPTVDPRGSAGYYWKVDGTFNGTSGQYELLVSPDGTTIWHYLFKGN